jgi:YidC/Oxa1 family membrane protein insertase
VLEPLYWAISWILLQWHALWNFAFRGGHVLATDWSWVLAIVFLVLTVRGLLFPVFVKQIRSQRAMQALQPKMKALQEKHKGDRETLQKEMMELYKQEKANPLMGCLPMFVQIPVFLGLFHVLKRLSPTNPHQDLYGWQPAEFISATAAKLFGAPLPGSFRSTSDQLALLGASGANTKIVAAVCVIIMMATTFLSQRQMILKTGWNADPQQRMIQKLMLYGVPLGLLFSGWAFPLGVIIYWVTNNLFTLGQQQWVLRKYPPPVQEGATPMKRAKTPTGTAAAGKSGAAKPAKSGLFGKTKAEPEPNGGQPVVESKALAPKPGAKPVNPKKGGTAKKR